MAEDGPGPALIAANDHGTILTIVAWFLTCIMVLLTAMRLAVRSSTQHFTSVDDILLVVAAFIALGSTFAISFAVLSGLGKNPSLLNDANIRHIQKEIYAATILYVLAIGISKLSIIVFLLRLACTILRKIAIFSLGVIVICWTIAIMMGVAFQCELPRPWDTFTGKCIAFLPFWITAISVDIVTDLAMIVLPIYFISGLQLEHSKKTIVIFIFASRVILIGVSIVQLIYLKRFISPGPADDSIPYSIAIQCHATLSVIVACSPALRQILDKVRTTMSNARLTQLEPESTFARDTFKLQAHSNNSDQAFLDWKSKTSSKMEEPPKLNELTRSIPSHRLGTPDGSNVHLHTKFESPMILKRQRSDIGSRPSTASSQIRSPPRPPSPPDELRPDLTIFTARPLKETQPLGNNSVQSPPTVTDFRRSDESQERSFTTRHRDGQMDRLDAVPEYPHIRAGNKADANPYGTLSPWV